MSNILRKRYVTVDGRTIPYRYNIRTREVHVLSFVPWKAECWTSAPEEVADVIRRNPHRLAL